MKKPAEAGSLLAGEHCYLGRPGGVIGVIGRGSVMMGGERRLGYGTTGPRVFVRSHLGERGGGSQSQYRGRDIRRLLDEFSARLIPFVHGHSPVANRYYGAKAYSDGTTQSHNEC